MLTYSSAGTTVQYGLVYEGWRPRRVLQNEGTLPEHVNILPQMELPGQLEEASIVLLQTSLLRAHEQVVKVLRSQEGVVIQDLNLELGGENDVELGGEDDVGS